MLPSPLCECLPYSHHVLTDLGIRCLYILQTHRRRHINQKEYIIFNDELVTTTATRVIRDLSDIYDSLWYQNIILGDDVGNINLYQLMPFKKQ